VQYTESQTDRLDSIRLPSPLREWNCGIGSTSRSSIVANQEDDRVMKVYDDDDTTLGVTGVVSVAARHSIVFGGDRGGSVYTASLKVHCG